MPSAQNVVEQFYADFARRDGAAMAARYAPDAQFWDPVFLELKGADVGAMWTMLCEQARKSLQHYPRQVSSS